MKIAVVSANLGGFEKPVTHVKQSVPCDIITITDKEFPPRHASMTPRLQARIVKTHMWDFAPGYDLYLWVDSSHAMTSPDAVKFMTDNLAKDEEGDGPWDLVGFGHPDRKTILEEADYLKKRLAMGCPYITPRYENELIDEQLAAIRPNPDLWATTIFMCRDNPEIRAAMKEWWYQISRYHSIDQLSFSVVTDNVWRVGRHPDQQRRYFTYTRNKV